MYIYTETWNLVTTDKFYNDNPEAIRRMLKAVIRGEQFLSPSIMKEHMDGYQEIAEEKEQPKLSPREKEVLKLIAEGKSRKEIGRILNISVRTLDTHRTNILLKLGCKSTAELVHYAVRRNLVELI